MIDIESLNKAITLTKQGNFEEAEKLYLELFNANPKEYLLLSTMGLFYVNIGNFEKASEFADHERRNAKKRK